MAVPWRSRVAAVQPRASLQRSVPVSIRNSKHSIRIGQIGFFCITSLRAARLEAVMSPVRMALARGMSVGEPGLRRNRLASLAHHHR